MSEVRPITRALLMETLLYDPLPGPLLGPGASGMTQPLPGEDHGTLEDSDRMDCLEGSNLVALRLACIGDEMDLRLRGRRLAQLPGRAMHSLAITYSQTGLWGVLRSLTPGLTSLRDNMWAWRHLAPSAGVAPGRACRRLLPMVLLVLLVGTLRLLLL